MSYKFTSSVCDFEITNEIPNKQNGDILVSVNRKDIDADFSVVVDEGIGEPQADSLVSFFIEQLDSGSAKKFIFVYEKKEDERIAGGIAKSLINLFQKTDEFKPKYVPDSLMINETLIAFERLKNKIYREA